MSVVGPAAAGAGLHAGRGNHPPAGTGQTLSVSAAATADYNAATATVSINVTAGTTAIATTTNLTASASTVNYAQSLTLTAAVSANSGSTTPTGNVDFYDTTTSTDLGEYCDHLSGGTAANYAITDIDGTLTVSQAALTVTANNASKVYGTPNLSFHRRHGFVYSDTSSNSLGGVDLATMGTQTITATYAGNSSFLTSNKAVAVTVTVTSVAAAYILDPSAPGALSLSGNATLQVPGVVVVDSSSATAILASGNAMVSGTSVQVVGKVSTSGNAKVSPAPITGSAAAADPLAGLAAPSTSGLTSYGAVNLSGNSSETISQGIYSSIAVSGNGKLTLNPGIYVIAGGGFSVSGNGSVSGSGVLIDNAANSSGTYGSVTLSGNGNISLTPMTTGTYAGILIYQPSGNTHGLSLSGNGMVIPGGLIYAPKAPLTISGNGQFKGSIIVDTVNISGNTILNALTSDGQTVYTPDQIRTAYGVNGLSLDGTGQTIAIVDAYDNPDLANTVDTFDAMFGPTSTSASYYQLYGPASSFLTVVNQQGQTTNLPAVDPTGAGASNWEMEEALDVEWVHAVAPGANIVLVEANSQSLSDLMTSVATAAGLPGVSVVSMSWGFTEGQDVLAQDEALYDSILTTPTGHQGVTFVASTGDYGTADPEYPAFSPNVVAVGGTSLTVNADNSYNSEVGWGGNSSAQGGTFIGSGGGVSQYEAEPAFQTAVQTTGYRTTPDVSLVADPNTGTWIADTYNFADNPWTIVGGTSLSAPSWAGLFALTNEGRAAAGAATLNSANPTEAQQDLYNAPVNDFNDITSGYNGYTAGIGYDLVTGLGTPEADRLLPDLIAPSGTFASQQTVTVTASAIGGGSLASNAAITNGMTRAINVFDAELDYASGR